LTQELPKVIQAICLLHSLFQAGWSLGEPDLALAIDQPYSLGPTGDDVYRCFVFPYKFDQEQYVTAAEIVPGNPKIVHHVLLFLDTKGAATKLDEGESGSAIPVLVVLDLFPLVDWAVGLLEICSFRS